MNIPGLNTSAWSPEGKTQTGVDESTRKRYKAEDREYALEDSQASPDIQFIDCLTPEHATIIPNTIYACAQIHNPPSSKRSSIYDEQKIQTKPPINKERFSCPENKNVISTNGYENKEGRFSYPGMGEKFTEDKKYVCRFPINDNQSHSGRDSKKSFSTNISSYSYCDLKSSNQSPQNSINLILTSSSVENIRKNENDFSKQSTASPSSPSKSPRYSLLVGDTSSENTSSLNTPVFDMDVSTGLSHFERRNGDYMHFTGSSETKDLSNVPVSEDSESNVSIKLKKNQICKILISFLFFK